MEYLLIGLIPAALALVVCLWLHTIDWLELGITIVASTLIAAMIAALGAFGQTWDTEIWNGSITGKQWARVSCSHSYECNCYTTTDSKGNTTRHCSTCYEHTYDVNWWVNTTIGMLYVPRVDRQGVVEPKRWTIAYQGEPVSDTHSYTNWVKAVPDSLINFGSVGDATRVADIRNPTDSGLQSLWRIDRVLNYSSAKIDTTVWSWHLAYVLSRIGPAKQINANIVLTDASDQSFASNLRSAWLGGKKNEAVIIIGTDATSTIRWVSVFSWSKNTMFDVYLRDEIYKASTLDEHKIMWALEDATNRYFERRPMSDFEYLRYEIEPPMWVVILAIVLSLVVSGGLIYFFHGTELKEEIFG